MFLFSTEKLRAVLEKSKWSRVFLGLAFLQLIAALAFLIPVLVNVQTMYSLDVSLSLFYKSFKVSGECIMFIAFEVWKLWLAFDGVLHSNSKTTWASAASSLFSFSFSILMIVESVKWMEADELSATYVVLSDLLKGLKQINQNLLISLSCISFLIIPPTFYAAFKVAKDFDWNSYKKIGSSIKIQNMYTIVQWFSLVLKIDIYFEFCAYGLYFIDLSIEYEVISDWIKFVIVLPMLITNIPFLILSRYAISRENKALMILFILLQTLCLAAVALIMLIMRHVLTEWYAFTGLCVASLLASIGTIGLAITCLLNFNKGLKEFVQWKPFSRKAPKRRSTIYNNTNQINPIDRLEDQRINEPIDD